MPLDGHAHLVAQGWSGKGTGLRHGAITKPVTVIQKKTLAGIGKDRDEAFPFWDHVFQAASVSIQVKVHNSDDESDSEGSSTPTVTLQRTSTGIISNRRPVTGTPALSGPTTPSDSQANGSDSPTPRLSIMAVAKQQAARQILYSMFYRGSVLSTRDEEKADFANGAGITSSCSPAHGEKAPKKSKKRKDSGENERKRERKRQKREAKEDRRKKGEVRAMVKGKGRVVEEDDVDDGGDEDEDSKQSETATAEAKAARMAEKAERKRRKEEKKARKEEKRKRKAERRADDERFGFESEGPYQTVQPGPRDRTVISEENVVKSRKSAVVKRTADACNPSSNHNKRAKIKSPHSLG